MHLTAVLAMKLTEVLPEIEADWIGVDKGALSLARQGVHMTLAIGDFDSVEKSDLSLIRSYADNVICLNPVKDDSDSEAALNAALAAGYEKIWMIGGLGGRVDHEYVNLKLAMRYPGKVVLFDEKNKIEALSEGRYIFEKNEYSYMSFFTEDSSVISLSGFKYPLEKRKITKEDLYTLSNEITGEAGIVTIHEGKVLTIQCKD